MPQRAMDGGAAMYRKYGMPQRAMDGGAGMAFSVFFSGRIPVVVHHKLSRSPVI